MPMPDFAEIVSGYPDAAGPSLDIPPISIIHALHISTSQPHTPRPEVLLGHHSPQSLHPSLNTSSSAQINQQLLVAVWKEKAHMPARIISLLCSTTILSLQFVVQGNFLDDLVGKFSNILLLFF
jgi:hypothetical protein